jgi:hypothetical protein
VFRSAVLTYVPDHAARWALADEVTSLCPYWICNEAPRVMPDLSGGVAEPGGGRFLLSVNRKPVAWTDPHGASITWIAAEDVVP